MNEIKWYDSRCIKPHSKYYDYYLCLCLKHSKVVVKNLCHISIQYKIIGWNPKDNYTDGEWDCENPKEVLYWTFLNFKLPDGMINE